MSQKLIPRVPRSPGVGNSLPGAVTYRCGDGSFNLVSFSLFHFFLYFSCIFFLFFSSLYVCSLSLKYSSRHLNLPGLTLWHWSNRTYRIRTVGILHRTDTGHLNSRMYRIATVRVLQSETIIVIRPTTKSFEQSWKWYN